MSTFHKFLYELKYAWRGLAHHWVLSLSALAAVAVSMFLVGCFLLLGIHVSLFADNLEESLRLHVVLVQDLDSETARNMQPQLESYAFIDHADFSDKDAELQLMIAEKGEAFAIYQGENNPLSNAWFLYLKPGTDIEQAAAVIEQLPEVQTVSYGGTSTVQLAGLLAAARWVGFAGSLLLAALSLYLIYNTIRTTIYSRQDEIAIMRQVGADNAFIKHPFELEGMLLGLAGSLLPTILILWGYGALYRRMGGILFANTFTLLPLSTAEPLIAACMLAGGLFIGWLASFLAVTKYIKASR